MKKKKDKKEKSEKHEKEREKKTNKDEKRGWHVNKHAAISAFISTKHPDTRGRSPCHTAFTKAVCVLPIPSQQEPSENTMQTHTQWRFGFGL